MRAFLACSIGVFAIYSPAHPQTATDAAGPARPAAAGDESAVQDVVVTAQRRSERLQDVPIAVNAISQAGLTASGIKDVIDLRVSVPGLNVTNTNGYVTPFLRGIGTLAIGPGIENPIATYIDGVYIGAPLASLLELSNIEQVEVLKGPQGTLFGRNATGGLIQVRTKDPTQRLSGSFDVTGANYGTVRGDAYISGGLATNLRADVAVFAEHQSEGWGRNLTTGKDIYTVDHNLTVRSKAIFEPNSTTKFTLIGDYSSTRNTLNTFLLLPGTVSAYPSLSPTPVSYPDRYDSRTNKTSLNAGSQFGVSLRADQQLGAVTLASTTAYRQSRYIIDFDFDATPADINEIDLVQKDKQFSEELQLLSPSRGRFRWVLGGFYYDASGKYDPNLFKYGADPLTGCTPTGVPPAPCISNASTEIVTRSTQKTASIAGYAQGTYELLPATNLTLGVRYTSEKRSIDGDLTLVITPLNLVAQDLGAVSQSKRSNKATFRVSLDHRFSDAVLAYASFNRGFKSGGFNAGLPPANLSYEPETLDAYEVGLKTDLFERRVRFNVSAFYYDYNKVQSQSIIAYTIGVINAGGAELYGADADLEARLTRDLTLTGGFSYLHSRYTDFPGAPSSSPLGNVPSTDSVDARGNRLPNAPAVTLNAGLSYRVDLAGGDLNLNGNVYYSSGWYAEPNNVIRQTPFTQLNALAKWTSPGGRYNLSIWGKNLNDVQVQSYEATINSGIHFVQWAAPRTFGATIGFAFH